MIDLHCHYLPGIDDGARSMAGALSLARAASLNGIRHAVLTPHLHTGRWDNWLSATQPVFEEFQAELAAQNIDLSVSLGGEVHLTADALTRVTSGDVPFIGQWEGKKVLLLELPDSHIPTGATQAVEFLLKENVIPMIAHPERNKSVMRSLSKLKPLVECGCLFQLTAASVCGKFGPHAFKTAHEIIRSGWATAVATDAHNLEHRPPILAEAYIFLVEKYGYDYADAVTKTNPALITNRHDALQK